MVIIKLATLLAEFTQIMVIIKLAILGSWERNKGSISHRCWQTKMRRFGFLLWPFFDFHGQKTTRYWMDSNNPESVSRGEIEQHQRRLVNLPLCRLSWYRLMICCTKIWDDNPWGAKIARSNSTPVCIRMCSAWGPMCGVFTNADGMTMK